MPLRQSSKTSKGRSPYGSTEPIFKDQKTASWQTVSSLFFFLSYIVPVDMRNMEGHHGSTSIEFVCWLAAWHLSTMQSVFQGQSAVTIVDTLLHT